MSSWKEEDIHVLVITLKLETFVNIISSADRHTSEFILFSEFWSYTLKKQQTIVISKMPKIFGRHSGGSFVRFLTSVFEVS